MQMSLSVVTGTVTFLLALPPAKTGTLLFRARYSRIYALKIKPTGAPFRELFVYLLPIVTAVDRLILRAPGLSSDSVLGSNPASTVYFLGVSKEVTFLHLNFLISENRGNKCTCPWHGCILTVYARRLMHHRYSASDGHHLLSRVSWQDGNPKTVRFNFLLLQINMKKAKEVK